MTRIKLCGITRPCEIQMANVWKPEYIGFVFAPKSRRYVPHEAAAELKRMLAPGIQAVGVFVNERVETVAELLEQNIIDLAQIHGNEDEAYIRQLRALTGRPVIRAFCVAAGQDTTDIERCTADYVLLDSGAGTGTVFDWKLIQGIRRPYFLAGGLTPGNVGRAVDTLHPFAVDVSSGIETDGVKDAAKIAAFIAAVGRQAPGEQTGCQTACTCGKLTTK